MLTQLKRYSDACGFAAINTPLRGEAATAAILHGVSYFEQHKKCLVVADDRVLRSTVRGLSKIAGMKDHVLPAAQAEQALGVIAPWVEFQILASIASAHAYLFSQGRANPYWTDTKRKIATNACKYLGIK